MPLITIPIAASSDDAYESQTGTVNLTDGSHTVAGGNHWAGFRFVLPGDIKGAAVNSAYMRINLPHGSFVTPNFDIYGQAHDNAPTFSASSNDISNRSQTTNKANWSATLGTGVRNTPSLVSVIAEVIGRAGWSNGSAIVFIFDANPGVSFRFNTFDGTTFTPELVLDYTPATTNIDESVTLASERAAAAGAVMGVAAGLTLAREQTASGPGVAASDAAAALIRELELLLSVTDSSQKWWEPSGAFSAVGAYRAIGASSSSAARVNLINPGTNDLTAPGAAPTWAVDTGWSLDGVTHYFATGLSSDGDYTMIVRFSDVGASDDRVVIGGYGGGDNRHWGSPQWFTNQASIGYGSAFTTGVTATGWTSGVLAVAANKLYQDGTLIHTLSGSFSGTCPIVIGALNENGTVGRYFPGKIQAVAIYDGVLSDAQVAEVSSAMAALTDTASGGFDEALALLISLSIATSSAAGAGSGLALGREMDAAGSGAAGASDAAGLMRVLGIDAGHAAGLSAGLVLPSARDVGIDASAGLTAVIALMAARDMSMVDGFTVLESVALGRLLGASSSSQMGATAGLSLEMARVLSGDETAAMAASVSLALGYSIAPVEVVALSETALLGMARAVGVVPGLLLAEVLALASARGVDVAEALGRAEVIALGRTGGVVVLDAAALGAALGLAVERGLSTHGLADALAGLGLERSHDVDAGPMAGIAAAIGLQVYRAVGVDDELNIIVTHRHIFVVDRENRLFIVKRESRAFDAEYEDRTFSVKRGE